MPLDEWGDQPVDEWRKPLNEWGDTLESMANRSHEECARLGKENERLTKWVKDLQSDMCVNCVYCGARFEQIEGGPHVSIVLKDHMLVCEKHPMSALKKENDELREKLASKITGETSDGYHTFNELYHHRAVLFAALCKIVDQELVFVWKSKKHHDGTMYDGMFIVGMTLPSGQVSYHYDINPYWNMFDARELDKAPEWDGHTPADAIDRIERFFTR